MKITAYTSFNINNSTYKNKGNPQTFCGIFKTQKQKDRDEFFKSELSDKKEIKKAQRIMEASFDACEKKEAIRLARNEVSFLNSYFRNHYEELNEAIFGKKRHSVKKILEEFKQEAGIELHVDNNISNKDVEIITDILYELKYKNMAKGYKTPEIIYVTDLLGDKKIGGVHSERNVFLRFWGVDTDRKIKTLKISFHHENAHYMDKQLHRRDYDYFKKNPQIKRIVEENVCKYAATDPDEFVACLFEKVESGKFYIYEDENHKRFLRRYIAPNQDVEQYEIYTLAQLYKTFQGPKIATSKNLPSGNYVEARFD